MQQQGQQTINLVLIRGATMWLIMALILAWCMVGLNFGVPLLPDIFQGKFHRLLQAHLDFLMMSGLLLGFYCVRVPLPLTVRWAMVIGAFTNSSLFLLMAIFPVLDQPAAGAPETYSIGPVLFQPYLLASLAVTSYGFGKGAVTVLRSTFTR